MLNHIIILIEDALAPATPDSSKFDAGCAKVMVYLLSDADGSGGVGVNADRLSGNGDERAIGGDGVALGCDADGLAGGEFGRGDDSALQRARTQAAIRFVDAIDEAFGCDRRPPLLPPRECV